MYGDENVGGAKYIPVYNASCEDSNATNISTGEMLKSPLKAAINIPPLSLFCLSLSGPVPSSYCNNSNYKQIGLIHSLLS